MNGKMQFPLANSANLRFVVVAPDSPGWVLNLDFERAGIASKCLANSEQYDPQTLDEMLGFEWNAVRARALWSQRYANCLKRQRRCFAASR